MKIEENMSEDDRDIDIESDDDNDSDNNNSRLSQRNANSQNFTQADKRAHHNALERKRRDHIKDSFNCLREAVPSLQGEKVASRAQILKKTADYIQVMRRKNQDHEQDIDALKKQNASLEAQIRLLEKARDGYGDMSDIQIKSEESDSSDVDDHNFGRPIKKLKTNYQP